MNIQKNLSKYGTALLQIDNINKDSIDAVDNLISAMEGLNQKQIASIAIKNKSLLLSKNQTKDDLTETLQKTSLTEAQAAQTAQEILNAEAKTANRAVTKLLADETFKQATAEATLTIAQKKTLVTDIQSIITKGTKNKIGKEVIQTQVAERLTQAGVTKETAKNTAVNLTNSLSQKGLLKSIQATTTGLKAQAATLLATPMGMATAIIAITIAYVKLAEAVSTSTKELKEQYSEANEYKKFTR